MSLPSVDLSAARPPADFEEVLSLVSHVGDGNVTTRRLDRVHLEPGPRLLSAMDVEHLFGPFSRLIASRDAADPPRLL